MRYFAVVFAALLFVVYVPQSEAWTAYEGNVYKCVCTGIVWPGGARGTCGSGGMSGHPGVTTYYAVGEEIFNFLDMSTTNRLWISGYRPVYSPVTGWTCNKERQ